jgi:LysM repeat protein
VHRRKLVALAAALAAAATPGTAAAESLHTVQPGQSLWAVAAAHGLTTGTLAAANGLAADAHLLTGQVITIPSGSQATGAPGSLAPAAPGSYTVAPGDTLSAIAVRGGASVAAVASANGLDPGAPLLAGSTLTLPSGTSSAAPYPTEERVDPALVGQIAAEHAVSPSLATAIAEQESGFNNGLVSAADARGVMQLLPGTWDFVQGNLADRSLDASSAQANVRAGVIYLAQLLRDTGGDEGLATAAYYQGLSSVRSHGVFSETQTYVDSVMTLRQKYGG